MSRVDEATTAGLALAISVAVALWQFVKYLLEGGRVRVRMHAGLLSDHLLRQSTRSWTTLVQRASKLGGWYAEVAVIEVENPGRTAVTISDVSLDLGRLQWFKLGRRTVSPRHLKAPGATTEATVRLEPFDRAIFVFDVWQVLQQADPEAEPIRRPLKLRASVRIAGRRGRRRSPWRRGWIVKPGQVSFMFDEVEIGMAAYQAMWRQLGNASDLSTMSIVSVALAVRKRFPRTGSAPTADQLEELLEEHSHTEKGPVGAGLVAYYVARDLAHHY